MKVPGSRVDEDQRPGLAFASATPINASELHETLSELSWGVPVGSRTVSSEVQTPGPKGWPLPSAISQKEMSPLELVATSNRGAARYSDRPVGEAEGRGGDRPKG
jgi:hypothetical protein